MNIHSFDCKYCGKRLSCKRCGSLKICYCFDWSKIKSFGCKYCDFATDYNSQTKEFENETFYIITDNKINCLLKVNHFSKICTILIDDGGLEINYRSIIIPYSDKFNPSNVKEKVGKILIFT